MSSPPTPNPTTADSTSTTDDPMHSSHNTLLCPPETPLLSDPTSTYTLLPSLPTPAQYTSLRTLSHLTPPSPSTPIATALSLSTHSLLIRHNPTSTIIGMGRLVGDTYMFLQIVDIAILPEHQKKGLGHLLMRGLTEWVDGNAGEAYVSLVAERGGVGEGLYGKWGFVDVKPSVGMYRCERVRVRRRELGIE